MPSLIKCKATDCSYNGGEICSKQDIYVSGGQVDNEEETKCKSFIKNNGAFSSSFGNTMSSTKAGSFSSGAMSHTTIDCNVLNCAHNTGKVCGKNVITVDVSPSSGGAQSQDQTFCRSFQER